MKTIPETCGKKFWAKDSQVNSLKCTPEPKAHSRAKCADFATLAADQ